MKNNIKLSRLSHLSQIVSILFMWDSGTKYLNIFLHLSTTIRKPFHHPVIARNEAIACYTERLCKVYTGVNKGFTKRYGCNKLVYFEEYQWIQDAIARENN